MKHKIYEAGEDQDEIKALLIKRINPEYVEKEMLPSPSHKYEDRFKSIVAEKLFSENRPLYSVNFFSLAISLGERFTVERFVKYVDLNSPDMWVRGYREAYTPLHVAMDPSFPDLVTGRNAYLPIRKDIIDILIKNGARIDGRAKGFNYCNPALAAGDGHSWSPLSHEAAAELRAHLLLWGADPFEAGSYYRYASEEYGIPQNKRKLLRRGVYYIAADKEKCLELKERAGSLNPKVLLAVEYVLNNIVCAE